MFTLEVLIDGKIIWFLFIFEIKLIRKWTVSYVSLIMTHYPCNSSSLFVFMLTYLITTKIIQLSIPESPSVLQKLCCYWLLITHRNAETQSQQISTLIYNGQRLYLKSSCIYEFSIRPDRSELFHIISIKILLKGDESVRVLYEISFLSEILLNRWACFHVIRHLKHTPVGNKSDVN
jgi:hypothetical protein